MTPPKNYTYTTLLSHMGNVTLFYIVTLLYLITTPPETIQEYFKAWPCPSWDGLWAFVGFGLLGLGLYLLQRLTRKTLNMKANDLALHYKKPPLVDSHQVGCHWSH